MADIWEVQGLNMKEWATSYSLNIRELLTAICLVYTEYLNIFENMLCVSVK